MKKKITIVMLMIFATTIIIAEGQISLDIKQGKNNLTISQDFISVYASDLIEEYPQIQSISTSEYGNTYGYINTLGGIGVDILIEPNKTYEIYSIENITITLEN